MGKLAVRRSLLTATALGISCAISGAALAQDSAGATSLGNGLGGDNGSLGSGSLGASGLAVTAPLGGGFGIGNGVLPNAALGSGLVNLRDLVASPIMQPSGRAFDYVASLGAFAGYTDNTSLVGGGAGPGNGKGSTFERVNPSLALTANTYRIQGSLFYNPAFYFYNSDSAANLSVQSLFSQLVFTAVPDTLFVRANAFATMTSSSQLTTVNGETNVLTSNSTQVYSFGVSPYFIHSFGDVAQAYAGYSFNENFFQNPTTTTAATQSATSASNSGTQFEYLTLTSGSAYGVTQHSLSAQAGQFFGQDLRSTGGNENVSYTLSYAATRFLTVFGTIGYQNLHYDATEVSGVKTSKAYNYSGVNGSGGVRFTPNDLSSITASYGYYNGGNTLSLIGRVQPTARIVLTANSSTAVTTNGQDLAAFANGSGVGGGGLGGGGVPIGANGAPVGYALGSAATNPAPYRLTRSSLSAVYSRDLNSFFATVSSTEQNAVAAVSTTPTPSSRSLLGSLGWQHTLSESMFLTATSNYGQQSSGSTSSRPATNNPVIGALARLTDSFTPTLYGEIDYIFQHQQTFGSVLQPTKVTSMNEIYAGVTKRF